MEPQAPTTSPRSKNAPVYDGRTFADLCGANTTLRFVIGKKFAGQSKTAPQWVAALAAAGVTVELPAGK
jgi:hypothetical protein